jgi:hypothetical protein
MGPSARLEPVRMGGAASLPPSLPPPRLLQGTLMASRHVHSLLIPGRVVLYLNAITGLTELAMVCGGPEHVEAATASRASRWGSGAAGAVPSGGSGQAAQVPAPAAPPPPRPPPPPLTTTTTRHHRRHRHHRHPPAGTSTTSWALALALALGRAAAAAAACLQARRRPSASCTCWCCTPGAPWTRNSPRRSRRRASRVRRAGRRTWRTHCLAGPGPALMTGSAATQRCR